jgi:hypothetical protein
MEGRSMIMILSPERKKKETKAEKAEQDQEVKAEPKAQEA